MYVNSCLRKKAKQINRGKSGMLDFEQGDFSWEKLDTRLFELLKCKEKLQPGRRFVSVFVIPFGVLGIGRLVSYWFGEYAFIR